MITVVIRYTDENCFNGLLNAIASLRSLGGCLSAVIIVQKNCDVRDRVCSVINTIPILDVEFDFVRLNSEGDNRAEALIKGVSLVDSEYVMFLDCDDFMNSLGAIYIRSQGLTADAHFFSTRYVYHDFLNGSNKSVGDILFPFENIYGFMVENRSPVGSYVLRTSVAKSLSIPRNIVYEEDYFFMLDLLSSIKNDGFSYSSHFIPLLNCNRAAGVCHRSGYTKYLNSSQNIISNKKVDIRSMKEVNT